MSNLGDGIYENGYKQGKSVGKRQGNIETAINLLNETSMNDEKISKMVSGNLTPEEVGRLRKGEKFE